MVPIELSRTEAAWDTADMKQIEALATPRAEFFSEMWAAATARPRPPRAQVAAGFPDVIAAAIAIDPSIVTRSDRYFVDVETAGGLTSGETVVDLLGLLGRAPNIRVVQAVDAGRYKQMLERACR
jgi:purine nucleosidase